MKGIKGVITIDEEEINKMGESQNMVGQGALNSDGIERIVGDTSGNNKINLGANEGEENYGPWILVSRRRKNAPIHSGFRGRWGEG